MSVDVEATGYDEVIDFGERITNTMPERFGTYLEKFALEVLDEARSNLQNNRNINTGALLASLRILEIANKGFEITIGSLLPYAKYIEFGRGPVYPKAAKALTWIDKDTGKRIFSKYSGPVEPHPFFQPAIISKMNRYPEIVAEGESTYLGGVR